MNETIERIRKFREDREWDQFHTPANLSKAISIEANELLENFLWDEENYNLQAVKEELADVLVYCVHMADALDVNIEEIINMKMDKNEKKYPVEKEANELLENFLWDEENYNLQAVKEELADVLVYCVHMADALDVNIEEIINMKMDKNEKKYPVEKAKGNAKKYTEL